MNLSPKRLNIREMWKVHKQYKDNENGEILFEIARIFYPNRKKIGFSGVIVDVVNGLNYNEYSAFVKFIGTLHGN